MTISIRPSVCLSVCLLRTSTLGHHGRAVYLLLVPPMIEGVSPLYRTVVVGDPVELECNATGTPQPRVIWQKGTRTLTTSTGSNDQLTL